MKTTTIIIIIAALLCVLAGAGFVTGFFGAFTRPQPEDATIDYLLSIQKNPGKDYIDVLEQVIRKNKNQTVRDTAVNTLTSITIRKGETDKVIRFFKDLTVNEQDPVIMSAAYAGIHRIREANPLPPMGALGLSVSGDVKKGGIVSITATYSSTTDIKRAILGLDFPGDYVEPVTPYLLYTSLVANIPKTHTFQVRILKTGQIKIPVELTVSTDRTDYEQVERFVFLDVQDNSGTYEIG